MFLTIFLGVLTLILIHWLLSSPFYWSGRGFLWLIPWPLFGNTGSSLFRPFHDFWKDFYFSTQHNDIIGFHMFGKPALFIKDPKLIRQVMVSDADSYMSRGFFASDKDPFKKSLLLAGGEEWRTTRSKMTPYFTPARLKDMLLIVKDIAEYFLEELEQNRLKGPVEIDHMSMKLSTDVVVSTAFGLQPDSFKNPNSFFYHLQKELLGFIFGLKMLVGMMSPTLYNLLGFTTFKRSTNKKLCSFIDDVLESRIKGIGVRPDFMQGMTELYKQEQEKGIYRKIEYNSDGTEVARFDKRGVTAQCMIMFLAGTDTTGHSTAFMLYELAMNMDVQEKLRHEILHAKETLGVSDFSCEQYSNLAYLDMVVSETLRKYPVAATTARECTRSTYLGEYKVNKGTFIMISIGSFHQDPRFYPEPEKFDPERFSPTAERIPGTYMPFGLGPRTCIGLRLAELEMKMTACRVLSRYKLSPCTETPCKIIFGFGPILSPRHGIKLNVERLKQTT